MVIGVHSVIGMNVPFLVGEEITADIAHAITLHQNMEVLMGEVTP